MGFGCLKPERRSRFRRWGTAERRRDEGCMRSKGQSKQDFCRSLALHSDYLRNVHIIGRCPRNVKGRVWRCASTQFGCAISKVYQKLMSKALPLPRLWQVKKGAGLYWDMCGRSPIHVKRLHSGPYKGYESTAKKRGISQKLKCDPLFCPTPRSSVTRKGTPALILQQQMPVVSERIWGTVTKRNDPRFLFPDLVSQGTVKEGVLRAAWLRWGDEGAGRLFLVDAFPLNTSPEMHDLIIHMYYY